MAASYDIKIWQGNNPPFVLRFKNSDDTLYVLTDERFILTAFDRGVKILQKDSFIDSDFVLDIYNSTLTWQPDTGDTRGMRLGRIVKYELERWKDGKQITDMAGFFVVSGGNNVDA